LHLAIAIAVDTNGDGDQSDGAKEGLTNRLFLHNCRINTVGSSGYFSPGQWPILLKYRSGCARTKITKNEGQFTSSTLDASLSSFVHFAAFHGLQPDRIPQKKKSGFHRIQGIHSIQYGNKPGVLGRRQCASCGRTLKRRQRHSPKLSSMVSEL